MAVVFCVSSSENTLRWIPGATEDEHQLSVEFRCYTYLKFRFYLIFRLLKSEAPLKYPKKHNSTHVTEHTMGQDQKITRRELRCLSVICINIQKMFSIFVLLKCSCGNIKAINHPCEPKYHLLLLEGKLTVLQLW